MLRRLRPRSAYDVMAALALFLALGGGALAATGYIGSDGRVRSCVGSAGGVTLIKPAQRSCPSGKRLIAWNQMGPQGPRGPGAFQFSRHVVGSDVDTDWLPSTPGVDGLRTKLTCYPNGAGFEMLIESVNDSDEVQASGIEAENGSVASVNTSVFPYATFGGSPSFPAVHDNVSVIAMNTHVGKWVKFDLGGYTAGGACNFWGMITPPSN
ncbi:MAG: hypothetical protein ACJ760_10185 [Thermoleophilaceae bacterium]